MRRTLLLISVVFVGVSQTSMPAQDVMVVSGPGGEEELIPLVPQFVVTMDAPGRKIVVAWDSLDSGDGHD